MSFLLTKKPPFDKTTCSTTKPRFLLQKSRLERYWELVTRIMGEPVLKYANLSTIVKCRFYGLKRLLLTKQHSEAKNPRVS